MRIGRCRAAASIVGALLVAASLAAPAVATSFEPSLQTGSVIDAAERLRPGEYLWAPEVAPQGPVLLIVSLATQRATVYRNGVPIGITTVSTGRAGHRTPTGVFTILQKEVEHYSSLYDSAPMPYMERLTWGGVALHGGHLPGYPASHGCIRLPHDFARLLYGVTRVGMTVVVTDRPAVPRIAPADALLVGTAPAGAPPAEVMWEPSRAPTGPVSIVVSAGDRRVAVLRNGSLIGSAPVDLRGAVTRTSAFMLTGTAQNRIWLRIPLPGQTSVGPDLPLNGRIAVPEGFRRAVESVLEPGTTVVVTTDSLRPGGADRPETIIEDEPPSPR